MSQDLLILCLVFCYYDVKTSSLSHKGWHVNDIYHCCVNYVLWRLLSKIMLLCLQYHFLADYPTCNGVCRNFVYNRCLYGVGLWLQILLTLLLAHFKHLIIKKNKRHDGLASRLAIRDLWLCVVTKLPRQMYHTFKRHYARHPLILVMICAKYRKKPLRTVNHGSNKSLGNLIPSTNVCFMIITSFYICIQSMVTHRHAILYEYQFF